MDTKSAISKACEIVGGISSMARLVGVKPPTVHQWVTADRPIPTERCPDIERATNGTVTCEELRPDLADQWQYLRATRSPAGKPRPLHRYTQGGEYGTTELSVLCEACHERAHVVKDLTQELLARIHCCADSEILAILASYINGIQGPAHADTDDILKFAEDPFAESVGALAALASNRLDIYAIRGLCEQLSTAEEGGSITFTIPVKKRPLFGGLDL